MSYAAKPLPVSPCAQYTMPVSSISAQVGASLVNGIGARDSHIPVARFKRLTAFTRVPSDTPPNTYKYVAVWAKPYRPMVVGYGLAATHGPGVPPGVHVGLPVGTSGTPR